MKNNPKLQCFNQNLRNTNFIYYTTSKNKIAEVEKKNNNHWKEIGGLQHGNVLHNI